MCILCMCVQGKYGFVWYEYIYYLYLRPEVQSRTGRVMIHDKFIQ
jgi:hypothetical protein